MLPNRARAMAHRLEETAERLGVPPQGRRLITTAFELAMRPRVERLPDDHHPDFLHPGRTALILMEDAGIADATVIAAGTLCESLRLELAVCSTEIENAVGDDVRRLVRGVPLPAEAGDLLLEELVAADPAVQAIALAERLDHARHLHLRPETEWAEAHALTCEVYRPVASRVHPTFARRYRWWCGMFAERYLGSRPAEP